MAFCQKTGRRNPLFLWSQRDCGAIAEAGIPHRYRRLCPPVGGTGEESVGSDSSYSSGPNSGRDRCPVHSSLMQRCDPAKLLRRARNTSLILSAVIKKIAELKRISTDEVEEVTAKIRFNYFAYQFQKTHNNHL